MKTLLSLITICFITWNALGQETITIKDLEILNNTSWKGTLTYIDYETGKPTDVATTLQLSVNENSLITNLQYTYEPNKNVLATTKIKKNGTYFGKQKIINKSITNDGTVTIISKFEGKDDRKKATMFFTYVYNKKSYSVTKEVQYNGQDEKLLRNKYIYTRI
jgi:hypothetical protein